MEVKLYNQNGKEVGKTELPSEIFEVPLNPDLIHQAVVTQLANRRQPWAHTKTRGEVRGGGRKPWRQKGTGRARHGSIRSPIWIGGGVTFGPRKERKFSKKINKKMKRKALLMVLSGKAKDKEIILLDKLELAQPKTKEMIQVMKNLKKATGQDLDKGVLIALPKKQENIILAVRNIPKVETIGADSLNVVDVLRYKYLLMPKEAIEVIRSNFKIQNS